VNGILEVRGVSCHMSGVRALDDVSLSVTEGSILGIVGPNGAGKTTLFNVITGFVTYQTGDVLWNGASLKRMKPHQIANGGLVRTFQNAGGIADLTVRENLLVAARSRGEAQVPQTADLLNLNGSLDTLVRDCSLATRKLVGIGMGIVRWPRMLMLDEPLAGLDTDDRQAVAEVVAKVNKQGVTVVLVEHDVDRVLALSDSVVVLDVGRAVATGSPAELAGQAELRNVYLKA
jgi:branched-chain amino acid transport system ATP-binding protein